MYMGENIYIYTYNIYADTDMSVTGQQIYRSDSAY